MKNAIETINHNGWTIQVFTDPAPLNPRTTWDHLGTILYTSDRYLLGDKKVSLEEMQEIAQRDDVFCLPVFAYIHDNVMLDTGDKRDSSQCGIIYVDKGKARREFEWEDRPGLPGLKERVLEVFKTEIKEFSAYLSGSVYYYKITEPLGIVDHDFGQFCDIDECIESAKAEADSMSLPVGCSKVEAVGVCSGVASCSCT